MILYQKSVIRTYLYIYGLTNIGLLVHGEYLAFQSFDLESTQMEVIPETRRAR
jgi:hypothetical protein